ncbi:PepSY domain-containing protein [Arenimonas sp. MALMAid1274]|uniref:PepSY domain-containing protein n=1 Tax=Arenimonas sp. MALMAid1274 TaxID=3411630 RepID=UPI003BA1070A
MIPRALPLLIAGLLMAAGAATADAAAGDEASRRATEGVRTGRLVKLEVLLADAERRHPGDVLEVELEDGEYEIEILRPDGRVVELTYDARDGRLLETEIEDPDEDD